MFLRNIKLCYLCHYPLVDGGVPFRSLDKKKLSKWWLENLQTEFECTKGMMKYRSICKFCVWDARFLYENDDEHTQSNEESMWWSANTHYKSKHYYSRDKYNKYYIGGQMMPCCVKIEKLKIPPGIRNADLARIYKCYFCNATSAKYPVIDVHMLKIHRNQTFFKCDYVACLHLYFDTEEEKNNHMKDQHRSDSDEPKVARCIFCNKMFLNGRSLYKHIDYAHRKNAFKCTYGHCAGCFKSEADRQQHVVEKHQMLENVKQCLYCDKWVRYMTTHVNSNHKNIAIKCNYPVNCFTYFRSESARDEHIKSVHLPQSVELNTVCDYCGKSCPTKSLLASHIKNMHREIVRCNYRRCGQHFKTQAECEKHFQENHLQKEQSKTLSCTECTFKTTSKHYLSQHCKVIHGRENIKCPKCPSSDRRYKSKHALECHLYVIHAKKMACLHCKQMIRKTTLTNHLMSETCLRCKINFPCRGTMKKHKKVCKRKCEICNQEFSGNVPLLAHVAKTHKNVDLRKLEWLGNLRQNLSKSVKCTQCKKSFFNEMGLCQHVKIVHKTLLICNFCEKEFKFKIKLVQHIISCMAVKTNTHH